MDDAARLLGTLNPTLNLPSHLPTFPLCSLINLTTFAILLGTLDAMAAYSPSSSSSDGSEYHVAFRSPQQLRAFNAPYQLGRRAAPQP